jgi:hypothetical protein
LAGTEKVVAPRPPESFSGLVIAGIPVRYQRQPVAIAFGPPLQSCAEESPAAFTARLQEACFALTRQAEEALSSHGSAS